MNEFEIDLIEILLRIAAAVETVAENYKIIENSRDVEKHDLTQILRERKEPVNQLTYDKDKTPVRTLVVHEDQDTRTLEHAQAKEG